MDEGAVAMKTTPTQRSLKWLRDRGYLAAVVERFAQMRRDSKKRGVSVPSIETLAELYDASGMKCFKCERMMVVSSVEDRCRVMTVQHDRSGAVRLLCKSCNTSHAFHDGDSFYEIPSGHVECSRCRTVKAAEEFYITRRTNRDNRVYRDSRCKDCSRKKNAMYRATVNGGWNAYAAERRAATIEHRRQYDREWRRRKRAEKKIVEKPDKPQLGMAKSEGVHGGDS